METDREILIWFHERLVHKHGESELYDYMHRLRSIIRATKPKVIHRGNGCNSLKDLLSEMKAQKEG
jgi:hypothetical protein